ncbi:hypothetical protein WR25_15363 [Diploscapter pachys]|uniref:Uncharacterized protein n=1 Tax=Diploscapter pachys TaxID=2018661 RepID=A0A2A2K7X7_9BILA|nr:hypothetical protein WR25_15363 [Diploscapter pachys]
MLKRLLVDDISIRSDAHQSVVLLSARRSASGRSTGCLLSEQTHTWVMLARKHDSPLAPTPSTLKLNDVRPSGPLLTCTRIRSSQAIGARNSMDNALAGGMTPMANSLRRPSPPSWWERNSWIASMTK